ncbi:MAG: DUF4175 family protein, partial [Sandarakinorhabdus sp.]|nr:DUF4175 family protein [Sandarakinorhabdus sp.]
MSADAFVATWSRSARWRGAANAFAIGLPLILAAATLGWRLRGATAAVVVLIAGIAITAGIAAIRNRRYDRRWLIRTLDTTRPDMEDSADLLLTPAAGLNPLQRLQQARLHQRLETAAAPALRPAWSTHAITAAAIIAITITAAALLWPARDGSAPLRIGPTATTASGPPQLISQSLRINPPAYIGVPMRESDRLTARAPMGSRLTWTLRYAPQPGAVALTLTTGERIPLIRNGDSWIASRRLAQSMLYRIDTAGPLNRIDAIPDTPPVIRVIDPERTLTAMTQGQKRWALSFEVTDDYGVAATARLRMIVTKGEGENITFTESAQSLTGSGDRARKRFSASLDIASSGLTPGNDIVAQLIVTDNRVPAPQIARSASLILRWPPDLGKESAGMDGMVRTVLPAYFRSQRQVIIDAEALQAQRRRLPAATFAAKSDSIGADQRALRQRYGELLGDETSEAPVLPTSDAAETPKLKAPALEAGHAADDGHDHGAPKTKTFGNAMDVLADYGHAHDETASSLDPESAAMLRDAVEAMRQSEFNLRQAAPDKALPHAYTALRLIKKVQQAQRIFLSRTGPELPPIDPTRRLTGDRTGLV